MQMEEISRRENQAMKWNVRGSLAVFAGFLIHVTLGHYLTFGNMNTYITSYLRHRIDISIGYSRSIWINAVCLMGRGLVMMMGGMLGSRFGARWTCALGCFIFSGSIALTSISINSGFAAVVITYGLIPGFGIGIAYIPPFTLAMQWFPYRKGLALALVTAGFGVGPVAFNNIQTAFVNPTNVSPADDGYFTDKDLLDKVPYVMLVMGGVYSTIQIIACCLLFPQQGITDTKETSDCKESDTEKLPQISEKEEVIDKKLETGDISNGKGVPEKLNIKSENSDISKSEVVPGDMEVKDAFKTKELYILGLCVGLLLQVMVYVITMYKAFGQTFIKDDVFLATIAGFSGVANAIGKTFWGFVFDKSSYRVIMGIITFLFGSLVASFPATQFGYKPMWATWVISIFFVSSGIWAVVPAATAQVFGTKHGGTIYGLAFGIPAVCNVFGAMTAQKLQENFGWYGTFSYISILCFLAFLSTFLFPWNPEEKRVAYLEKKKRVSNEVPLQNVA
ncbi:monocarboxylate transporter 9-like isoform X2 [Limulus polyphemus]|nr:monocarboxylate transporter 9-like isoform X2 [Limulus polyphemus]